MSATPDLWKEIQHVIGVTEDGVPGMITAMAIHERLVPATTGIQPPFVVDAYHLDDIDIPTLAANVDIAGIELKATEGASGIDPMYDKRIAQMRHTGI